MKTAKSIFKTVSMITFFSIVTRFLGFIFRIYLSRNLGAHGMGVYQIAASIVGVFMTLVASGLPLTTAKMVAKYEHDLNLIKKDETTTASTIIALIISVISCVILLLGRDIIALFIKSPLTLDLIYIMCPALIFSSVYAVFRGTLWGLGSYFWVSFTEFLEQIIRIILTVIMVARLSGIMDNTKIVAMTFTLTCLISSILVIAVYFIKGGRLRFKRGSYKEIIKSAAPITGVRLASSFIQPLTALLIPLLLGLVGFSSSEAIGTYGVLMGMTFPLLLAPLSIVGSLSMVLIPQISVLNASREYEKIKSNITNSLDFSLFLAVILIPLYLSCGNLIGVVLFDNLSAGIYLQLASVCILPIVLNNIASSVLNALNLEIKSFINYLIGIGVMLFVLCTCTFVIKENAIILSEFLSTTVTALLNIRMIHKTIPNFDTDVLKKITKYALVILPSSVLGHLISNLLYTLLPAIIAGLIGGLIAITTTIFLVATFKIYDLKKFKSMIFRKRGGKSLAKKV